MTVQWLEQYGTSQGARAGGPAGMRRRAYQRSQRQLTPQEQNVFYVPGPAEPEVPQQPLVDPYYYDWQRHEEPLRPKRPELKQAPRTPARPTTGPATGCPPGYVRDPQGRCKPLYEKPRIVGREPYGQVSPTTSPATGCPAGYTRDPQGQCKPLYGKPRIVGSEPYGEARPVTGPASARAQPIQRTQRRDTGTGGCPPGYVRSGNECICDGYSSTPCDMVPPPKPRPSSPVTARRGSQTYSGFQWMSGVGQFGRDDGGFDPSQIDIKNGGSPTITVEEEKKTDVWPLVAVGLGGLIVGALIF